MYERERSAMGIKRCIRIKGGRGIRKGNVRGRRKSKEYTRKMRKRGKPNKKKIKKKKATTSQSDPATVEVALSHIRRTYTKEEAKENWERARNRERKRKGERKRQQKNEIPYRHYVF